MMEQIFYRNHFVLLKLEQPSNFDIMYFVVFEAVQKSPRIPEIVKSYHLDQLVALVVS